MAVTNDSDGAGGIRRLYEERRKRVLDAIQLKMTDRVPVIINFSYFPAKYTGTTCKDAFYDYDKWLASYKKTVGDYEPDMVQGVPFFPGSFLECLDPKQLRWPGHGVAPNYTHQSVEGEFMKADEYDMFMNDPTDFVLRAYLPRIYGTLEPFNTFPPFLSVVTGHPWLAMAQIVGTLEANGTLEFLIEAGRELSIWKSKMGPSGLGGFFEEIELLGFPLLAKARAPAPFDVISDVLRGMKGAMLDMYRRPDKIVELCERLVPGILESAVSAAKKSGNPHVFTALHRGAEGFMSLKQFETFYWPSLRRIIVTLIDEGLTPCVFFEGDYTSRLEYLLELPKGKVLAHFDATDMFKAKKILGRHMCIRGNVPSSLLQVGSPQDVRDYCKKLIDVVGKDGGFIMSERSALDEVKPENLKMMIDFTKEYGTY